MGVPDASGCGMKQVRGSGDEANMDEREAATARIREKQQDLQRPDDRG